MTTRTLFVCSIVLLCLTQLCGAIEVEVCLREQLSNDTYPHTASGKTAGVSVRAFGLDPSVPIEEWRETPFESLVELFAAYIEEHNIADADRYVLDFEKDFAHVHVENRGIIERSIQAVKLVRPGVDVSLFGTPFPPANGALNRIFSDADYLGWMQGLGVGYAPVLYIAADRDGNFPSLDEVEAFAELSLSVFPASESTPYLWHKWRNGGNWMSNPDIIDTFPNLDPLRIQLDVLARSGVTNLCFWHGDHDPAIGEMLAVLFDATAGDYDGDGDIDHADYGVWKQQYGIAIEPGTGADGNHDGLVNAADYAVWRDNLGGLLDLNGNAGETTDSAGLVDVRDDARWSSDYGATQLTRASSPETAIPEPASLSVMGLFSLTLVIFPRWRMLSAHELRNSK